MKLLLTFAIIFLLACNDKKTESDVVHTDSVGGTQYSDTSNLDVFEIKTEAVDTSKIEKNKLSSSKSEGIEDIMALMTTAASPCTKLPKSLSDLTSGAEYHVYKLDKLNGGALSILGFTGELKNNEVVFIEDYTRYSIVNCEGKDKKIGVGLRCFIHVKSRSKKLTGKIAKLTEIAANVELSNATAEFSLVSLGFAFGPDIIADGTTSAGVYNVENFGKLWSLSHSVMKLLKSDSKIAISPVVLP